MTAPIDAIRPIPALDAATASRFWTKVDRREHGCWEWQASVGNHGYGQFAINPSLVYLAHRMAYALRGRVMDHLCRNRRCVRPDHLEPVTQSENARRAAACRVADVEALIERRAS